MFYDSFAFLPLFSTFWSLEFLRFFDGRGENLIANLISTVYDEYLFYLISDHIKWLLLNNLVTYDSAYAIQVLQIMKALCRPKMDVFGMDIISNRVIP
jgi:hypothetical protein